MRHIKARFINSGGLHGEFDVTDTGVFSEHGCLPQVSKFWDAVVAQSLILDHAHAESLSAVRETDEDKEDPETAHEAAVRREILTLSDQYLVRANIFCLLMAFFEYAVLEIYLLHFKASPAGKRPKLMEDIVEPLQKEGIIGDPPDIYVKHVLASRDEIRNAFAHGRWGSLKAATDAIELYDVFTGTSAYFFAVAETLRAKGYDP